MQKHILYAYMYRRRRTGRIPRTPRRPLGNERLYVRLQPNTLQYSVQSVVTLLYRPHRHRSQPTQYSALQLTAVKILKLQVAGAF
eukprot:6497025-Prymnesium_polylepis.1